MGEARRRRLALIRGGKADLAKREEMKPKAIRLVRISQDIHPNLDALITKLYDEDVNKEQIPLRSGFIERLLLAGCASFQQARQVQAQAKQLIQPAGAMDVAAAVAQRDALASKGPLIKL